MLDKTFSGSRSDELDDKVLLGLSKVRTVFCHFYRLEILVQVQSVNFNPSHMPQKYERQNTGVNQQLQRHLGAPAATAVFKMTHCDLEKKWSRFSGFTS